jgi:hypothetical protein
VADKVLSHPALYQIATATVSTALEVLPLQHADIARVLSMQQRLRAVIISASAEHPTYRSERGVVRGDLIVTYLVPAVPGLRLRALLGKESIPAANPSQGPGIREFAASRQSGRCGRMASVGRYLRRRRDHDQFQPQVCSEMFASAMTAYRGFEWFILVSDTDPARTSRSFLTAFGISSTGVLP